LLLLSRTLEPALSVPTTLYCNKADLAAVKKMLERRAATLLPLSEGITLRAIDLMEWLTLSHGLQVGDALIAATALDHGLPALTANGKHFSPVEGLTYEAP